MEKLQAVKGFRDILTDETPAWRAIEAAAKEAFSVYGYEEIRTPHVEYTELFERSIGSETDIVEKEMYTFEDAGGRRLTLRPENTAGVVRAYIDNGIYKSRPRYKVYYMGPMFRSERPQKGRYRQFHQIGAEAFGSASALVDAEQIAMIGLFFRRLDVKNLDLVINSLGCPKCRPAYRDRLVDFLNAISDKELCPSCIRRRYTNPLRVLDCKERNCIRAIEKAPEIFSYLCDTCAAHHSDLVKYLALFEVEYRIDSRLVRGLDYYTRTVFEFLSGDIGSQGAVAAGGRYDGLVEELGGNPTPAVGFAIGVERLAMVIGRTFESPPPEVFLVLLGDVAREKGLAIAQALRAKGCSCELDYESKGLKGQMKLSNRLGAGFSLIIGESEIESGTATLQEMSSGGREKVPISGNPEDTARDLLDKIKE